jgi:hypothetical protein
LAPRTSIEVVPDSQSSPRDPYLTPRRIVASVAAAVAGLSFLEFFDHGSNVPLALGIPILLLVASAGLMFRNHLPSQILVRAALWSNLVLGTLIAVSGGGHEMPIGAILAVSTTVGLLALGRSGLTQTTERFAPTAFRASLILALVMALADTQSLALFGTIQLDHGDGVGTLACAVLMGVALFGLYRLQVWGVVLNIVANVLIATLAFTEVLDLPEPIVFALCTTAAIQVMLPLPLIVAMVRGRAPEETARMRTVKAVVVPIVTLVLASLAVYGWLTPGRLMSF